MRKIACLFMALLLLLPLSGCGRAVSNVYHSAVGYYFDTVVTVSGYCTEAVLEQTLAACAQYEALLSKTAEGSDVWNINHAQGKATRISADTLSILQTAQAVSKASAGAFDVTIAPAVALWDFSPAGAPRLPDEAALAEAAALCDYTKIVIESDAVLLPAGMQLDLGGVAKGYVADALAVRLRVHGVKSALISLGGNIVTVGDKPTGEAWRIGIKNPADPYGFPLAAVDSKDASVVTSGNYERGFTLHGVRYHHILDTQTGMPVQNGVTSVTVLGASSVVCDALSTACFALGPEDGLALARSFGARAVFVDEAGKITADEDVALTYF